MLIIPARASASRAMNPSRREDGATARAHTHKETFMRAYVLVTVGPGKARDIAKKIGTLAGVKMANACWGGDVYVVAEVNSTEDLNALVMGKIQAIRRRRANEHAHRDRLTWSARPNLKWPCEQPAGAALAANPTPMRISRSLGSSARHATTAPPSTSQVRWRDVAIGQV